MDRHNKSVECIERRKKSREKDGWHRSLAWTHAWHRDLHGHHLLVYQPNSEVLMGDPHWYKWIDGHFRGTVEKCALAKGQLEREAAGEAMAWGIK